MGWGKDRQQTTQTKRSNGPPVFFADDVVLCVFLLPADWPMRRELAKLPLPEKLLDARTIVQFTTLRHSKNAEEFKGAHCRGLAFIDTVVFIGTKSIIFIVTRPFCGLRWPPLRSRRCTRRRRGIPFALKPERKLLSMKSNRGWFAAGAGSFCGCINHSCFRGEPVPCALLHISNAG